ncbi:MAG: hypothetical protein KKH98_11125 [Spirochaetes bacterium]|nr:hypothetical protein [Spirochaetota bacterium]
MLKKLLVLCIAFITVTSASLYACFDTYLFLNNYSMVYPQKQMVVENLSEYSFNSMTNPDDDTFLSDFNAYYGLFERFSIQLGLSSSEKPRNEFKIDEYGIKGVLNVLNTKPLHSVDMYTLDIILAHRSDFEGHESAIEFSVPNIFYKKENILVVHPVFEANISHGSEYSIGGHLGLFHSFYNSTLIGIGAEYSSAQNGSTFNKRLVEGESAASLFLGAKLGKIFYLQNEFAKGLANSRDLGFASTIKLIF